MTDPESKAGEESPETIEMPAPTANPMLTAFGAMLVAAGLVTSPVFSVAGAVVAVYGLAGWIRDLLPGRGECRRPLAPPDQRAFRVAPDVFEEGRPVRSATHRFHPEEVHPLSAGARGGALGGVAMAAVALLYGLVSGRGIWYPVNLLAALVLPSLQHASVAALTRFDAAALVTGLVVHAAVAPSLGLCLGVLYPMLPRGRVLWAGLAGPILWSGLLYSAMGILNPELAAHVDWIWFVASQIAYGVVAAWIVERSETVRAARPGARSRTVSEDEEER